MTKSEIRELLESVLSLYPGFKLTKESAAIWHECLLDIAYLKAKENFINHVKTSNYPPSIAVIRGSTGKNKAKENTNFCDVTGREYELFDPGVH